MARDGLLNFGIGGSWGPEQDDTDSHKRWVVDFDVTWNPTSRLLLAGEFIYGGELFQGVLYGEVRLGIASRLTGAANLGRYTCWTS